MFTNKTSTAKVHYSINHTKSALNKMNTHLTIKSVNNNPQHDSIKRNSILLNDVLHDFLLAVAYFYSLGFATKDNNTTQDINKLTTTVQPNVIPLFTLIEKSICYIHAKIHKLECS